MPTVDSFREYIRNLTDKSPIGYKKIRKQSHINNTTNTKKDKKNGKSSKSNKDYGVEDPNVMIIFRIKEDPIH